jgi:hypothetical protein
MKYKCKTCGKEAEIDFANKKVKVFTSAGDMNFPSHPGCPLADPVDQIDITKLEKVS